MQHLDDTRRRAMLGALVGAVVAGDGPTAEQSSLLDAVGLHLLGLDPWDVAALDPDAAARHLVEPTDRQLVTVGLVVLDLARHPADPALARRVDAYLAALGGSADLRRLIEDELAAASDRVAADERRLAGQPPPSPDEQALAASGSTAAGDLAARLDALVDCPPGTLGRRFHEFYERHRLPWPDHVSLVAHDFTHVLTGYEPVPEGELALEAFLVASTPSGRHVSGLLASLLLFEVGMLPVNDIEPKVAVLGRPGAAELFGEALERGARCGVDLYDLDHLASADRPLGELRAELHLDPPTAGPFTAA